MKSRYKRVTINGITMTEHRYLIEQSIGRKLRPDEQVHHINGNRYDNSIENLKIVTQEEHDRFHKWKYSKTKKCIICGEEYEPYESKRKTGKVCSNKCKIELDKIHAEQRKKPIIQMFKNGEYIKTWESARDIQKATGYRESNICKCAKGKINSAYGYKWIYAVQAIAEKLKESEAE